MLKKIIDWLFMSAPVEEITTTPPTLSEKAQTVPIPEGSDGLLAPYYEKTLWECSIKRPASKKPKAKAKAKKQTGAWVRHRGNSMPETLRTQPDSVIEVRLRSGVTEKNIPSRFVWSRDFDPYDIMAYRVIKPAPKPKKKAVKKPTKGGSTMAKKKCKKPKGK